MRIKGLGLVMLILTLGGNDFAWTDILYLNSGASVPVQIMSFDGAKYRVLIENEPYTYDVGDVKGFAIERAQTQNAPMEAIYQKLNTIEAKIDNFNRSYEKNSAEVSQKIYNLNPVSLIRVLSQQTRKERDGTYTVWGYITNDSYEFIRSYRIRATLYDQGGNAVDTIDFIPNVEVIGPGERKRFEINFPKRAQEPGRVDLVPYIQNRPKEDDIGNNQLVNPAAPYRK